MGTDTKTSPVNRVVDTNTVELTGRVSGEPVLRELPSGDPLVTLRLVVTREGGGPVDTIELACWSARSRRSAGRLADGDRVAVAGCLRRRFFRGPGGAVSRYEVEVKSIAKER